MKSKNPKALVQEVELEDKEEALVASAFILSLEVQSGFSPVYRCDYAILRDFCKKESLDPIEVLRICKEMVREFVYD